MKIVTILLPLLLLSSCGDDEDKLDPREQAIEDIKSSDPQLHHDYLQCYALERKDNKRCLKKVRNHVRVEFKNQPNYLVSFQYAAEKLGFMRFLKDHGAVCDSMENSPRFITSVESYIAKCNNGNIYLLRFDYGKKEWIFVK